MKITKLSNQEIQDETLSNEELERQMLQKAIEKYRLNEKMDISPVVGEERDEFLPEIDYEKLPKNEEESIQEMDYNQLPKSEADEIRFQKLKQMLNK